MASEYKGKPSKCQKCWEEIETEGSAFFCMTCEGELCEKCTREVFSDILPEDLNRYLGALHQAGEMTCWGACPFCFGWLPTKFEVLDEILGLHNIEYKNFAKNMRAELSSKPIFIHAIKTHYAKLLASRLAGERKKIEAEKDAEE